MSSLLQETQPSSNFSRASLITLFPLTPRSWLRTTYSPLREGWWVIPSCTTAPVFQASAQLSFTSCWQVPRRKPLWQYRTAPTWMCGRRWDQWADRRIHLLINKPGILRSYSPYSFRQVDSDAELKDLDSIQQLCLSCDLPAPSNTNRKWLAKELLFSTVMSKSVIASDNHLKRIWRDFLSQWRESSNINLAINCQFRT